MNTPPINIKKNIVCPNAPHLKPKPIPIDLNDDLKFKPIRLIFDDLPKSIYTLENSFKNNNGKSILEDE